jgi:hypothetical protein
VLAVPDVAISRQNVENILMEGSGGGIHLIILRIIDPKQPNRLSSQSRISIIVSFLPVKMNATPESSVARWNGHSSSHDHEDGRPITLPSISGGDSGGIGAVAARIQDRAMQLHAEQTNLRAARTHLETLLETEKEEVAPVNRSMRRNLLTATNHRNGVELELYNARDKIDFYLQTIQHLANDIEAIQDATERVGDQWQDDVNDLYSRHHLDMEVYKQSWEVSLEAKSRLQLQREEKRNAVQSSILEMERIESSTRSESERLREDIVTLEQTDDTDGDVFCLATRVQEALTQVSVQRLALLGYAQIHAIASCKVLTNPTSSWLVANSTQKHPQDLSEGCISCKP